MSNRAASVHEGERTTHIRIASPASLLHTPIWAGSAISCIRHDIPTTGCGMRAEESRPLADSSEL